MVKGTKTTDRKERFGISPPTLQRDRLMLAHLQTIGIAFLCLFSGGFFLDYPVVQSVAGGGIAILIIAFALYRYSRPIHGYLLATIYVAVLIAVSPVFFGKLDSIPFGVLVLIFLTSYVLGDHPYFWGLFALFLGAACSYFLLIAIYDFPPGPYRSLLDGFHFGFAALLFFLTLRLYFKEYQSYKSALSQNQQFLDKIIDANPNPIFVWNNKGQIVKLNQAFVETFQLDEATTLLNKNLADLPLPQSVKTTIQELDQKAIQQREPTADSGTAPFLIDDQQKWLSFSLTHIRNAEGALEGTSVIITDVTEQKLAEQFQRSEKAMLRAIMDGATDSIIAFDQDKRIIAYNRSAFEANKLFLGFELKVGSSFFSKTENDWVTLLEESFDQTLTSGRSQVQYPNTTFRDQIYSFASTTSPIIDKGGNIVGVTLISKNITAINKAKLALEASEQRFRRFFEDAPLAILIRDPNKETYLDANSKALSLFGYSKKELLTIKRSELLYDEDTDLIRQGIQKLQDGQVSNFQNNKVFKRKDGSTFWARVNRSLLRIEEKDYLIGFVENIESQLKIQQALQQSEARLRSIVSNAFSLFVVNDATGKTRFVSPNIEKTLGYGQQEFLQINYKDLCHPDDLQVLKNSIELSYPELMKGKPIDFEFRVRKKDNTWAWFEIKLIFFDPTQEGPFGGQFLTIGRNIDAEKKARMMVEKNVQELHIKNQELQKYIESNMQLENFAYIASHDLRAPIRTVVSFAQLLERSAKDKLTQKELDFLNYITTGTSNMNILIDDLLAYSRVNTDAKRISTIALPSLLQAILHDLHVIIHQAKAIIHIGHLPDFIEADATKFRQLLQNLISNAIKFQREGIPPEVNITVVDDEAAWTFHIKDNGIGIPPEFQEKIFLLFKKLHPSNQYEGTGIGLALCKKIVEQHGGRLWVTSESGKGATFSFSIPKGQ